MYDIGLDTHKNNTYFVVLDNKSGELIKEGNSATTFRCVYEYLEPYLVKGTRIALESTRGFYPLYDSLRKINDIKVYVVNTVRLEKPAVKTDRKDAHRIAHLLRRDELPFAYIPEQNLRLQRELCSLRMRMVKLCVQCKNKIHSIIDKEDKKIIGVKDIFSKKGMIQLKNLSLIRKDELVEELSLFNIHNKRLTKINKRIEKVIIKDPNLKKKVELIDSIPGFARTLAFVCATELGPIHRFHTPHSLVSYAGVYPCQDSSAGRVKYGRVRRIGRKLFRWALVEGAHAAGKTKTPIGNYFRKKAKQKKSNHAAAIATANKLARIMYEVLSKNKPYDTTITRGQ
jgi:transposase